MTTKIKNIPTLDLHGDNLLDLETKVDRFITQCQAKNLTQIRIMTGKGTGKILRAVQKYLKLGNYPFEFEKMSNGQKNEGVLIVYV